MAQIAGSGTIVHGSLASLLGHLFKISSHLMQSAVSAVWLYTPHTAKMYAP